MTTILRLAGVTRRFGGLTAVDGVDLSIAEGERHALIGPNGAGKTTLFNLISGELAPTSGRIEFLGMDVTALSSDARAARGMARTFQITKLFPTLTVRENVLLACAALDASKRTLFRPLIACEDLQLRATRVIADFGLHRLRDECPRDLSYGDQRRIEVALAMAQRPRLLLLDEPMAGLSAAERASLTTIITRLHGSVSVLMIEHDMDVAFAIADRITVLAYGAVLAQGTRGDIAANAAVQDAYLGARC